MKKYIFAHPVIFAVTVLAGIITQGSTVAVSLYFMYFIDSITGGDINSLIRAACFGAVFAIFFFTSLWSYTRLTIIYYFKTIVRLKNDMFSAVMDTKISDFNQANSAKYISVINNDIQMIQQNYLASIMALSKDIAAVVFSLVSMFSLSPANAIIALAFSAAPMIFPYIFGTKLSQTQMASMQSMARLNVRVKDFLSGFEVIKIFRAEKVIKEKFAESALNAQKDKLKAGKVSSIVGVFTATTGISVKFITYVVAGYFVIKGDITVGAVVALSSLSSTVQTPMQLVSQNLANIKSTKKIREGLLKLMEPTDTKIRSKQADLSQGIKLKNVSFKYTTVETEPIAADTKPQTRIVRGSTLQEALANAGISDMSKVTVMNAADLGDIDLNDTEAVAKKAGAVKSEQKKPEAQPVAAKTGDFDIASILAANGLGHVDLSKVKVMQANDPEAAALMSASGAKTITANSPSAPEIPEGAVLKNVSYTFRQGGKYAVIGSSGSGKSTLLKLIMGYYDDYAGQILIGQNEIRDISRESLYDSVSMMSQSVFLLDDTLQNNVTLYSGYNKDEYENAVRQAKLTKVIENLPQGSDTKLGEGGNKLSGGERQRVAIARALLKGCNVMLFDEATANLDNQTACEIENSIIEMPNITGIFVTHRYTEELLSRCHGILVMKDGELIESGTFEELYDKRGYFYSLFVINQ